MKGALVLDVIRGVMEIAGAHIELAVDSNMSQATTMETSFIITRVIRWKEDSSKVTSPIGFMSYYGFQFLIGERGGGGSGNVWCMHSRGVR